MSKTVYRWDPTTNYQTSQGNVPDDYQLKANETFDKPERIDKSTVKRVGNQWVQLTDEEDEAYKKTHFTPIMGGKPNNAVPELQKMVMSQQSTITQIQKTIMAQQYTITELKKGSN